MDLYLSALLEYLWPKFLAKLISLSPPPSKLVSQAPTHTPYSPTIPLLTQASDLCPPLIEGILPVLGGDEPVGPPHNLTWAFAGTQLLSTNMLPVLPLSRHIQACSILNPTTFH